MKKDKSDRGIKMKSDKGEENDNAQVKEGTEKAGQMRKLGQGRVF